MTLVGVVLLALASLLLGLYLGHRWATHDARIKLASQARRLQRVIDFADDYIERSATQRAWHVIRDPDGHIVELAMRCGTPTLLAKKRLDERTRRMTLH